MREWPRAHGDRASAMPDRRARAIPSGVAATLSDPSCPCSSSPVPRTPRRRASSWTATRAPRGARRRCSSCRRSADVELYRARAGPATAPCFGARVERFDGLLRELACRGGVAGRTLTELQRERVAAAAIAATPLERAGRRRADARLRARARRVRPASWGRQRVEPPRFVRALRDWAAGDAVARRLRRGARRARPRLPPRRWSALGRRDRPQHVTAALDALREDPRRWGATPVFLYGFDDLTPLQRDAVETLANARRRRGHALADLRGRARTAFAARATLHQELLALERDRGGPAARSPTLRARRARRRCTTSSARCIEPERAARRSGATARRRAAKAAASGRRSSSSPPRSRA